MKKIHAGAVPQPDNEDWVVSLDGKELLTLAVPLLQLLAQVCDEAVSVGGTWLSLGTTRKVDSLVLTIHTNEGNVSTYADTFEKLLRDVPNLL